MLRGFESHLRRQFLERAKYLSQGVISVMIYTELTTKAMRLAYDAHYGQFDKAGLPYVFHPLHLAEQMTDEISTCVALLHDVVEDTDVTLEDLKEEFPLAVVEAVELLTHKKETRYSDYIERLKSNPVAKKVKLADIAHNSDESRFSGVSHHDTEGIERRRIKYARAKAILED